MDPGSDTEFIRNGLPEQLGLQGDPITCCPKILNKEYRQAPTIKYNLNLEDWRGNLHPVVALGLESITTLSQEPDLAPIKSLLSRYPEEILHRPRGRVDVLLGLRNTRLHGKNVSKSNSELASSTAPTFLLLCQFVSPWQSGGRLGKIVSNINKISQPCT